MDGRPTTQPHLIEEGFPLMRLNWDFEHAEGRECLRVYRQTLMAGLRAAVRKPTNLSKVNLIRQEPNESPAAFLERLMEAFRQYTPMEPQADESRAAVLLAFINQAAPDIRRKLYRIERLGEQSIQDLVRAAEKVFKEEREFRAKENRRNQKELAHIFFAGTRLGPDSWKTRDTQPKGREKPARPTLKRDQCAYCKEQGHWKNECPKRKLKKRTVRKEESPSGTHILYAGEDSD